MVRARPGRAGRAGTDSGGVLCQLVVGQAADGPAGGDGGDGVAAAAVGVESVGGGGGGPWPPPLGSRRRTSTLIGHTKSPLNISKPNRAISYLSESFWVF
jgi:hypothetical protein